MEREREQNNSYVPRFIKLIRELTIVEDVSLNE